MTCFTDDDIHFFMNHDKVIFPAGSTIIGPGKKLNYVYFLYDGKCSRTVNTATGDVLVYDKRKSDRSMQCLIGILCFYLPVSHTIFSFIADTDCVCYRLAPEVVKEYLLEHPKYLESLLEFITTRYSELNQNLLSKLSHNTASAVCGFILDHSVETGEGRSLDKSICLSEIGRRLGVHRVTISKIISELTHKGVLKKNGTQLMILDSESLLSYAQYEQILEY